MARKSITLSGDYEMSEPLVHVMIRYLASDGITNDSLGVLSVVDLDARLSEWIDKGYQLRDTHFVESKDLSMHRQGLTGHGLVFIFVKV